VPLYLDTSKGNQKNNYKKSIFGFKLSVGIECTELIKCILISLLNKSDFKVSEPV